MIVGGVAVGAFVILELVKSRGAPAVSGPRPPAPTDPGFINGLVNLGAAIFNSTSTTPATATTPPAASTVPVYVMGEGYVQGGANAPIDPKTGSVWLPDGEIFGPRLPS